MWNEPPAYQAANRALREIVLLTHFASNSRQHRCGIFTGWLIIEPDLCTTEHLELWSSIVSNCNGNWAHNISSPINWYDRILQYWHARQKRNQNWKKNPAASNLVNPKLEKLFQYIQGLLTSGPVLVEDEGIGYIWSWSNSTSLFANCTIMAPQFQLQPYPQQQHPVRKQQQPPAPKQLSVQQTTGDFFCYKIKGRPNEVFLIYTI